MTPRKQTTKTTERLICGLPFYVEVRSDGIQKSWLVRAVNPDMHEHQEDIGWVNTSRHTTSVHGGCGTMRYSEVGGASKDVIATKLIKQMVHDRWVPIVATAFSKVLHKWLHAKEMEQVVRRNKMTAYAQCCATHDFCDANMAMDEALRDLGIKLLDSKGQMRDDVMALWNDAWSKAKADGFAVDPKVAALQAAESALAEGDANCGGDADNVFHAPLLAVRAALKT